MGLSTPRCMASASLLVTAAGGSTSWRRARAAGVSVGLHLNLTQEMLGADPGIAAAIRRCIESEESLPCTVAVRVRDEVARQFHGFHALAGEAPAHVNHHACPRRIPGYADLYADAAAGFGVPGRCVPEL